MLSSFTIIEEEIKKFKSWLLKSWGMVLSSGTTSFQTGKKTTEMLCLEFYAVESHN